MSEITTTVDTSNFMINQIDFSKIFLRDCRYERANFTNSDYEVWELAAGTLMGRIGASQELTVCKSGASDGSQYPVGILAENRSVDEGDTVELTICVSGDVSEGKVVFDGTDDMDTLVSDRSFRDRIAADTVGIKLVKTTQLNIEDND